MIEIEHHLKTGGVAIKRDTYDESVNDTETYKVIIPGDNLGPVLDELAKIEGKVVLDRETTVAELIGRVEGDDLE